MERIKKASEMWIFLLDIFSKIENPKCQSCSKELYHPARTYYFDHLIEKSKRPDLATERENIFICCLECHTLKTGGHPTEVHKAAIEKAKEKFGVL